MLRLMAAILAFASDNSWVKEVESRIDHEAVEWLRGEIRQEKSGDDLLSADITSGSHKPCYLQRPIQERDQRLYILISFSVPEESWLALSREVDGYNPVFVLRGIPNNSFGEFGKAVAQLRERGFDAEIQIDPRLFSENNISAVPAFMLQEEGSVNWVHGNVSTEFALSILRTNRGGASG